MTYRGQMHGGVVILQGDKPADGTWVDVIPSRDVQTQALPIADHPALGIWKDRTDLPPDSIEASKLLRERMTRPTDIAGL